MGTSAQMLRRREFLTRGVAGAGAIALGSLLSGCGSTTRATGVPALRAAPPGGGKAVSLVRYGVIGDAVSLDYAHAYDLVTLPAVSNMTEPLLRVDQAGRITPNLATAYDLSDPLRLVLTIRPGVTFWDGAPLTAEDVAYSLSRHLDPKVASSLAFYYQRVDHVVATGPLEVTLFLSQADSLLLWAMGTTAGSVTSKAFVERHGKQFGKPAVGTMGTGAYRFVSWLPGHSFTVERNPSYWNQALPRKVNTWQTIVIPDEASLLAAHRSGEIDASIAQLSGKSVASLASDPNINQYADLSGGASMLTINRRHKPFDDPRVARALSLVVPRQHLLQSVWGGQAALTKSIVGPPMWAYERSIFASAYDALPDYTHQDFTLARQLISQADAYGATGTMLVSTSYDAEQAHALQVAAAQIGINLSVKMTTYPELISDISGAANRNLYAIANVEWFPDVPEPTQPFVQLFYSTSNLNYTNYKNPLVDALLDEARGASNSPATRAHAITQAQALVVQDQVLPAIVDQYNVQTVNKRIGGYHIASPQWTWDPQLFGSFSGT